MSCVYFLRCSDDTLYTGHTADLDARLRAHNAGSGAAYTAARRPVRLLYSEECQSENDVLERERQLKKWSAKKKLALAAGKLFRLHSLATRRGIRSKSDSGSS